jgi:hypothetical protein
MEKNGRDLRELVFGDELSQTPDAELQAINDHPARQDELNRLLQLREALLSLTDEEPPRRTVLVSAASTARAPWWKSALGFGSPGWGFAGAMALTAAILAHGWLVQPNPAPLVAQQNAPVVSIPASSPAPSAEEIEARVQSALEKRMQAALQQVRAEIRTEHQKDTAQLVAATEDRLQRQHSAEMFRMTEALSYIQKKYDRQMVTNVALMGEAR